MQEVARILSDLATISTIDLRDSAMVRAAALKMEELFLKGSGLAPNLAEISLDNAAVARLQRLYEKFETDLESEFAGKISRGESTIKQYPLYPRLRRLIENEVALAGITIGDRVCFIGSGPFPISAILYAQLTSVCVDCLDKANDAVMTSVQLVKQIGLADKIRIINTSGENGNISVYDVIIVALLAQPKSQILSNISAHAPKGARVICRTTAGTHRLFYKETPIKLLQGYPHFNLADRQQAGSHEMVSSLLIKIDREASPR